MQIILENRTLGQQHISGDIRDEWERLTGRPLFLEFRAASHFVLVMLIGYIIAEVAMFYYSSSIADALGIQSYILRLFFLLTCIGIPYLIKILIRDFKDTSYAVTREGIALLRKQKLDKSSVMQWDQISSASCIGPQINLSGELNGKRKTISIPLMLFEQELLFALLVSSISRHHPPPERVKFRLIALLNSIYIPALLFGLGVVWVFLIPKLPSALLGWGLFALFALAGLACFIHSIYRFPFYLKAYGNELHISSIGDFRRVQFDEISEVRVEITNNNGWVSTFLSLYLSNDKRVDISCLDQFKALLLLYSSLPKDNLVYRYTDTAASL